MKLALAKSGLFKRTSRISTEKGPTPGEQLMALAENKHWKILDSHKLNSDFLRQDETLCKRVNAFKHALQVYGPKSALLNDLRQNFGPAKGHVFHAHIESPAGTTFNLEWEIIDEKRKLLALVGFGKRENYQYKLRPMGDAERLETIVRNEGYLRRLDEKQRQAKEKIDRIENNYRHCK